MTGRELRIACGTSSSERRYALWRPEFGPFVEGDLARRIPMADVLHGSDGAASDAANLLRVPRLREPA